LYQGLWIKYIISCSWPTKNYEIVWVGWTNYKSHQWAKSKNTIWAHQPTQPHW